MPNNKKAGKLNIISGILLIIAGTIGFAVDIGLDIEILKEIFTGNDPSFTLMMLLLSLDYILIATAGIFILLKKSYIPNFIIFIILAGLCFFNIMLNNAVQSLPGLIHILYFRNVACCTAFLGIAEFSLIARTKPYNKIMKFAFVPGALYLSTPILYIWYRIKLAYIYSATLNTSFSVIINSSISYIFIFAIYYLLTAAGLFLYGIDIFRNPISSAANPAYPLQMQKDSRF